MILKGSQRGGGEQLADHLMNEMDNDHVEVLEVRGFMSEDLRGALAEAHAVSKGTKAKRFLFSLSLNPPKDANPDLGVLLEAVEAAEERLGLKGQPRAIIAHEKEGRRHVHVVWSRIDVASMKAIELPFFKQRLCGLSKELYLQNEWELPQGHRENGWKNPLNFTLEDWQQAKRLGLDPREVKQVFREAWSSCDGPKAFAAALEHHGYHLARGDRRGFVALDVNGEVFSVARMTGVKTKDLNARFGSPDRLPSVEERRADLKARMSRALRGHLKEYRRDQKAELDTLRDEARTLVHGQRLERAKLRAGQKARWLNETRARAERFRSGVRGLLDVLTGRAAAIRRDNEREAMAGLKRDRGQSEWLFGEQFKERAAAQRRIEALRAQQRQALMRLARQVTQVLRQGNETGREPERHRYPRPGLEL